MDSSDDNDRDPVYTGKSRYDPNSSKAIEKFYRVRITVN